MRRYLGVFVFLLCVLPFFASLQAQSDLAFPQITVGGQYETVVQVINEVGQPTGTTNDVTITVFQGSSAGTANGTAFPVRFDGGSPQSSKTFSLAAFQELTTILTTTDTTPRNGWIRITSALAGGKISANLLFRTKVSGTVTDSVGVASPQRFRHAVIQVDSRDLGSNTGLAFVNPDPSAVTVTMDLYQGATFINESIVTLQNNQHFAQFISEIFPTFGRQQGTLVIETSNGRQIPYLTLRSDAPQLTGIPMRPLGFVFQYTVKNSSGATVETGFWMFDFIGFDLVGIGRRDTDATGQFFGVRGSWFGTNFQFTYRITFTDGTIGMVVFNGTSAGQESTHATPSDASQPVTGKVTTVGANGQVVSVNDFTAVHKY
ncbi:MAG TPA: hypothetical protein VGL91_25315 [Acidobacteriota bacterium]